MSDEPTDKELADALGISEIQVQIYLSQRGALLTPGCWMLDAHVLTGHAS